MKLSRELSEDSFNRFLSLLDTDRERAGAEYEILHRKLVRFFEWRECYNGEELADETVNRVARKLAEGHEFSGNPIDFTRPSTGWSIAMTTPRASACSFESASA